MVETTYGTLIARCTAEACAVCCSTVFLSATTLVGLAADGDIEVHVAEECGHEVTRAAMVTCPPSEARYWEEL